LRALRTLLAILSSLAFFPTIPRGPRFAFLTWCPVMELGQAGGDLTLEPRKYFRATRGDGIAAGLEQPELTLLLRAMHADDLAERVVQAIEELLLLGRVDRQQ
jgi:hypothetical protein